MNDSIATGKMINRLATVLHELRGDWDEDGVVVALGKATDLPQCTDGYALIVAAARAAQDMNNRTPAVIALDGAHWRPPAPANPRDKPAYYGPSADFCRETVANEITGQPQRCGMFLHPGEDCTHRARAVESEERTEAKAEARRAVEGAQGTLARQDAEAEQRRDAAKGEAA